MAQFTLGISPDTILFQMDSLKIGLTGGIATGKSTVTGLFAQWGVPIIDADQLAHELVQPGQQTLTSIIETFGIEMLQKDGHLDRARLRAKVFAQPQQRQRLEAILHPIILRTMQEYAAQCQYPYCILSIPLLLETQQMKYVDRILVVDCPPHLQRQRLRERNHFTEQHIEEILAAQANREARLAIADDIIDNQGDIEALSPQVTFLHQKYIAQAKK